jgi:TetR/AcrR family acrAB operon transcriptional repressor
MARCTKQEALETRSRIIDAAEQVFHRQGVSNTSLNDVAQEAGLTRGAIYWHFKNKHDLFVAMCERIGLPLEERMDIGADPREPDPLGRLREALVYALRETATSPRTHRVLDILFNKCELVDARDAIAVRRQQGFTDAMRRFEGTLANAIARGQLPDSLDVHFGAILLHAAFVGVLDTWLFEPGRFDLGADAERYIDAALESLRCAPALRRA